MSRSNWSSLTRAVLFVGVLLLAAPTLAPAAPRLFGGEPAPGLAGFGTVASLVNTVDGPRSVLDVYATFSATYFVVDAVDSVIVNISTGFDGVVHAGRVNGADWSPHTAVINGIDSFVTIGGIAGPGNVTIPGLGWGDSGFASVVIPTGSGWSNGTPIVLQGKASNVPTLGPATLLARFVVALGPGAAPVTVTFGGVVTYSLGPGTPKLTGAAAISGAFLTPTVNADLNDDGVVNGADLGLLLSQWGVNGSTADLNADGVVDGADLGLLLASWLPS